MKSHRFKVAIAVMLGALLAFAPSAEAGRKISSSVPQLGLWFKENSELTSMSSVIYGKAKADSLDSTDWKMCGELSSKICTDAEEIMIIHSLPICTATADYNCIAGTWAISPAGERIEGIAVKRMAAKGNGDFSAVPSMGLSEGTGTGTIFKYPGVLNSGGKDTYLVSVRSMFNFKKKAGDPANTKDYSIRNFRAGVLPVEEFTGNYVPVHVTDGYGSDAGLGKAPDGSDCQSSDYGICEAIRDFPDGYQFGVKIRSNKKLTGWFHGRIQAPTIETIANGDGQDLTIQALPVRVTALDYLAPIADYSQAAKDLIFSDREWGVSGDPSRGIKIVAGLDQQEARDVFKLFNSAFKDKSSYEHTYWTVNSLGYFNENDSIQRCSDQSGNLAGIVTTNSLLYSAGPPTFNKETESLDYQLASPHFESTGKETVGSYDLLIRSDVARCIYGFSKAPISATISIVSSEGEAKAATTVLGEKNGWLFVSAQGFGFSSPFVRVKLTQEAPVVTPTPSPSASASQAPVAKAKTTISCVKGKVSKKVTGLKPVCPKGYKLSK
ncbi:hypothetical protein MCEMRE182_00494 [Candidatus Nanopelagicaceae bacterium]